MGRIPIKSSLSNGKCHLNQKRKKSVVTVANAGKSSLHNVELVVALSMSPTLMRSLVKNVAKSCPRKRKMRTQKKKVKTSRTIQTVEDTNGNQEKTKTNLSQNVGRADVMSTAAQDVSSTGTARIVKLKKKQMKKIPNKSKVTVTKALIESVDDPTQATIAVPKVEKKVAMKKTSQNKNPRLLKHVVPHVDMATQSHVDMATKSNAAVRPDS